MLHRTCGSPYHSAAGIRRKVQQIMARSGPGEEYRRLRYATRETAKHVVTGCIDRGCIDRGDALLMLVSAGLAAGMPAAHAGLLVEARLGVELAHLETAA